MASIRWGFHTPTQLVFGDGVRRELGQTLRALGVEKPLLVTDAGIRAAGIADEIEAAMKDAGIAPVVFDEVTANPDAPTVHRGVETLRDAGCDGVVALGGGSPIDAGKAMAMLATNPGDIRDFEIGKRPVEADGLPLVTIPTTAGTGSEVTYWSVITDPDRHRKFDVGSPRMAPRVALDDPELTYGLPARLTAATGMDALTHAIEALTTRNAAPHTSALARQAIEMIVAYLPLACECPDNAHARRQMLMASATAGLAFPNVGLGAVHGLTAPIGGHYNAPHGEANAALLPYVMEFNRDECDAEYSLIGEVFGEFGSDAINAAIEGIREMNVTLGIRSLGEMGVPEDATETLARESMGEFSNNNSNPAALSVDDATDILRRAIRGE